jgi:hypothetical protein
MVTYMIKKVLTTLVCVVLVAGGVGYLFKEQLWEKVQAIITADMYVAADTDSFDPGLAIGERFPNISALYQGEEITSVDRFVHDKGMVFIANRSADW